MSTSTNFPSAHTMRWAPAQSKRQALISGFQTRLVTTLATGLDLLFSDCAQGQFGILMYHRVSPRAAGLPAPSINVTPRQFRLQMEGLLRRGFNVWRLKRVLECYAAGESIPSQVTVLTFDDGFESFYTHAVPVLKDLNLPATVFINTAFLDSQEPFPFDHWANQHRAKAPGETYRCMSRQQCFELLDEPLIEIGAHTHTHQDFRNRPAEFRADLRTCVDFLESEFGIKRPTFAFPYGTPHLGFAAPELVAIAKQVGVACALTTESTLVSPNHDPFQWGRLNVFPWDSGATVAARLHGWYCWAPQTQRRLGAMLRRTIGKKRGVNHAITEKQPACKKTLRATERLNHREAPFISVIVPTFNRAHWLSGAIESLVQQETYGDFRFELVIADNASADETQAVVREAASRFTNVPIQYVRQELPGDAPTRNAGVQVARGEWFAFFDDDQFADRHWLWELFEAASVTGAQVIGGPVHLDLPEEQLRKIGTECRKALREIAFYSCLHPYVERDLPGTGNALVAKHVFDQVGAFDVSFTGGGSDSDFFLRARNAGFELWYTPRAIIRHRIPAERLTPEYFRWDALSGGATYAELFDYKQRGKLGLVTMCAVRVGHALCVNLPLMVFARLRGDQGEAMGRRTLLWRAEGYLRQTLLILAPRWFAQRAFFESLDFRLGRNIGQTLAQQPQSEPIETARQECHS